MADTAPQTMTNETLPASTDAEMDAALEAIIGPDTSTAPAEPEAAEADEVVEAEDAAPPDRERDSQGRFTSSDSSDDDDSDGEVVEAKADEDSVKDTDDYRKALAALGRDGVSSKLIDRMTPDEVIEWGMKRAADQAKVDDYGRQLAEARKAANEGSAPESGKEQPGSSIDIDAAVKPFVEVFGDDVAEPLKQFGDVLVKSLSSEIEKQSAELSELRKSMVASSREALRSAMPKEYRLSADDRWSQVLERREEDVNAYPNEREALLAAARHVFADEIIKENSAKLRQLHKKRDQGQPMTASLSNKTQPPQTQDALEDAVLNALQDGDYSKVQRLTGRRASRGLNEIINSVS